MRNLERIEKKHEGNESRGSQKFLVLFLIGFVMIFVGTTILVITALFFGGSTISFGGVVFIGPFPIVIGVGPDADLMVLFATILAILSIVTFLILRREMVKPNA
ncbi:DUF131 domain-containing protein [Candidatus Bathyarchaeota archaeon]|nr:DUF131 domain-containing protein [Candidatus Bathyarchaeota archaeon]